MLLSQWRIILLWVVFALVHWPVICFVTNLKLVKATKSFSLLSDIVYELQANLQTQYLLFLNKNVMSML